MVITRLMGSNQVERVRVLKATLSYSRPMASLIERNVVSRQSPIALTIELSLMAVVEKSPGRKDEVVASLG